MNFTLLFYLSPSNGWPLTGCESITSLLSVADDKQVKFKCLSIITNISIEFGHTVAVFP